MNIYRGCEHGCIYCDSRSDCYRMEHEFEDIEIKENALILLEEKLKNKRKKCMIGTGAMSDPYMPIEKELKMTRGMLEIAAKYDYGVTVITKSDLILRDIDLLKKINDKTKAVVQLTLTTFDDELCRIIEPNVCVTSRRAEVLKVLKDNGIPSVVWLSPILPFINDTVENLDGLLEICHDAAVAGIVNFGFGVTLRDGDREYFYKKLDENFAGVREKYIKAFGNSYICNSPNNDALYEKFANFCKRHRIMYNIKDIFEYIAEYETKNIEEQLSFL